MVAIILARSFGAAGYGDFIKVTSFVTLFYLFCDFGINAIFLQQKTSEESFKVLLYLRLLVATLFFIVANIISVFLPYSSIGIGFSSFVKLGIFIYSFELFIQSILFSTNAVFQKKLRYDFLTKSSAVGSFISLILVLMAVISHQSLYVVISALVISDLLSVILALFYAKEKIFPITIDFKISKELLISSFPLGMMLIFNLIYFRIDSLILSVFRPSADVGIYGLSYLFFDFLLTLPLFISNSLYPILIKEKENKNNFLKLTRSYFLIYLGLSVVVLVPFWFVSPLFSLIRPDFSVAIIPFRILLLGLPFFFLTSFFQWILITFNKTKFLMNVYFISMVINIFLNFIFIPKGSYIAAAIITVLSEGLVFLLLIYKLFNFKKNAEII